MFFIQTCRLFLGISPFVVSTEQISFEHHFLAVFGVTHCRLYWQSSTYEANAQTATPSRHFLFCVPQIFTKLKKTFVAADCWSCVPHNMPATITESDEVMA